MVKSGREERKQQKKKEKYIFQKGSLGKCEAARGTCWRRNQRAEGRGGAKEPRKTTAERLGGGDKTHPGAQGDSQTVVNHRSLHRRFQPSFLLRCAFVGPVPIDGMCRRPESRRFREHRSHLVCLACLLLYILLGCLGPDPLEGVCFGSQSSLRKRHPAH